MSAASLLLLTSAWHGWVQVDGGAASPFTTDVTHPQRFWVLATAWLGSPKGSPLAGVLLMLTLGVLLERSLGTWRYLVSAAVGHVVGVAAVFLSHPLIALLLPAWAKSLTQFQIGGTGILLMGPLLAFTALIRTSWRRRLNALALTLLVVIAAVGGSPTELAALWAGAAGLVLGIVAWSRQAPAVMLPSTGHAARNRLALLVACWCVAVGLPVLTGRSIGPLANVRVGLMPVADGSGGSVGRTLLPLMPLLVQLVLAEGLRRGRRFAAVGTIMLQAALGLCTVLSSVSEFRLDSPTAPHEVFEPPTLWTRLSHGALPLALNFSIILLVTWSRKQLRLRTRPGVKGKALRGWLLTTLGALTAGLVAIMLLARQFTPNAHLGRALADLLASLVPTSSPMEIPTTAAAALALVAPALLSWLAAAFYTWKVLDTPAQTPSTDHSELTALVREHGASTLGWMLTWPGNEAWVSADGRSGFAYRPGHGVALTLGDPAARDEDVSRTIDEFATFARDAGLVPALYSVHEPAMRAARERGWTVLQVAEEAVLDLEGLEFRGKAWQDVRTALNHAKREGVTAQWTSWRTASAGQRDQIRSISQSWARDKALPEMGFTLGGLREIDDDDTRLLLAVDEEGTVHAVTSWMPVYEDGKVVGLTLDLMRKREGCWRPSIEYLIARAVQDAQAEGLRLLSLSGAPLARSGACKDLEGDEAGSLDVSRFNPLLDTLASVLEPAYGFASLHAFKRKFQPRHVPMYLAVPDVLDLPSVGVAISAAYMPDLGPAQTARFAQALVTRD